VNFIHGTQLLETLNKVLVYRVPEKVKKSKLQQTGYQNYVSLPPSEFYVIWCEKLYSLIFFTS